VKLIVGLGNPGGQYQLTRHNIGFLVVDRLAEDHSVGISVKGFEALYGKGRIMNIPVLLAKPQTFMNRSGMAIQKLFDYFKIDASMDVIVIHDDLDLPFGIIRLKADGGHGGHKGLLSTIEHLGGPEFLRVRVGIGKPSIKTITEDYVLSRYPAEEMKQLPKLVSMTADAVTEILSSGMQKAMNKYNGNTINNYFNEEV
jgi:peptidyl-tRNA hydrolase, PTH1 family